MMLLTFVVLYGLVDVTDFLLHNGKVCSYLLGRSRFLLMIYVYIFGRMSH